MYIAMIKNSIAHDQLIAVSLAIPVAPSPGEAFNKTRNIQYAPKRICTAGTPVILEEFSQECIKILIHGVQKVELLSLLESFPHPIFEARALVAPEEDIVFNGNHAVKRLTHIIQSWLLKNIIDSVEREIFLKNLSSIHYVTDYICMFIIRDLSLRQFLLECHSLVDKIYILNALLAPYNPYKEDLLGRDSILSFDSLENSPRRAC